MPSKISSFSNREAYQKNEKQNLISELYFVSRNDLHAIIKILELNIKATLSD